MKKVFEVLNEGKKYDISSFLQNHPGGINYVERYRNRDVLSRMKDTRHSQSAFYLLREYQNGGRDDSDEDLEVGSPGMCVIFSLFCCLFSIVGKGLDGEICFVEPS